MGFAELFLSAQGRTPRLPSLIAAGVLLGLAALYEGLVGATLHWITGWLVYPALFYAGAGVLSKRLHDRGRSGWWAAPILISIVAVWPHPGRLPRLPLLPGPDLGLRGAGPDARRAGRQSLRRPSAGALRRRLNLSKI